MFGASCKGGCAKVPLDDAYGCNGGANFCGTTDFFLRFMRTLSRNGTRVISGQTNGHGGFSPQQAAAAVAAAAAAAASEVARRSIEGFGEVRATSELIPPNTPIPAMPGLDDSDASDGDMTAEPSAPIPKPEVGETETHFLNKNELNQPDVMSSIAGLPISAVKPSKDAQFEQALERVRASRREIAEQAAKGFEDMKAYYEKELQQERSRSASVSASMERLPHRAAPHHPSMAPPPPRDPASVVAAAAAEADALGLDRSAKGGGVAWQLDEEALRASYPSASSRLTGPAASSVWPVICRALAR